MVHGVYVFYRINICMKSKSSNYFSEIRIKTFRVFSGSIIPTLLSQTVLSSFLENIVVLQCFLNLIKVFLFANY